MLFKKIQEFTIDSKPKDFFQGDSRGVTVLKPCTLCGASPGCLGSVPGSGLLQAPRSQFLCFSSSVLVICCCLLSSSERRVSTCDRFFFSVGHIFLLVLFQASRHSAVANGFRHSWGVCLHLLPWSFLSHVFLYCDGA